MRPKPQVMQASKPVPRTFASIGNESSSEDGVKKSNSSSLTESTEGVLRQKWKGKVTKRPQSEAVPTKRSADNQDVRNQPKGSGQFYDPPCRKCDRINQPCEKRLSGGVCVLCKARKSACEYAQWKSTKLNRPNKSRIIISSSSEDEHAISVKPPPAAKKRSTTKPPTAVEPHRAAAVAKPPASAAKDKKPPAVVTNKSALAAEPALKTILNLALEQFAESMSFQFHYFVLF
jgi:hypothetical protein